MKKIFIIIILAFISVAKLEAQSNLDFKKVNELSLIYYYASEWDSLINIGIAAESNDIDYYYLNYRMAIAFFYKENYFTSTFYFEKSLKQNAKAIEDDFFRLIYYKAILFSKQNNKVLKISQLQDTIFDIFPATYKGEVDVFYFKGKISRNLDNKQLRMTPGNIYSEIYYQQNISMFGVGTSFLLDKNMGIDFRYSNAKLRMIAAIEDEEHFYIRNFDVQQNTVNVKPSFYIGNSQRIDMFLGASFLNSNVFAPLDSSRNEYGFRNLQTFSFVVGLAYRYRFKNIDIGVNSVFSSFSNDKNIQIGASILWYPFGNLNLYSSTEVSAMNTTANIPRLILYQEIGFKTINKLWVELSGYYGDVNNFSMITSNYSFEIANHTKGIASAKIIYTLSPSINLFANTQYWWRYTDKLEIQLNQEEQIKIINYQQINFIGGLEWKF